MPPEIVTAMVAELDGNHGAVGADRVEDVALRMGAARVETDKTDDGRHLVSAEFHHVGDSTRAAVEVVRLLTAATGTHRPAEPVPGLRMALCTGAHTAHGTPSGTCPLPGAARLVEWAEPGRVLATEATVIVAGGGVPPGVDLVDRGSRRLDPDRSPERVYELRIDVDAGTLLEHRISLPQVADAVRHTEDLPLPSRAPSLPARSARN